MTLFNRNKNKEFEILTESDCPVCELQKKVINGLVNGVILIPDHNNTNIGVALIEKWERPNEAVISTKESLEKLSNACYNTQNKDVKTECAENIIFLKDTLIELEFLAEIEEEYSNIGKKFDVINIDNMVHLNKAKKIGKNFGINGYPTTLKPRCNENDTDKSCANIGLLNPLQLLTFDAVQTGNKDMLQKIDQLNEKRTKNGIKLYKENGMNKRAKEYSDLRKRGKKKEIKRIKSLV